MTEVWKLNCYTSSLYKQLLDSMSLYRRKMGLKLTKTHETFYFLSSARIYLRRPFSRWWIRNSYSLLQINEILIFEKNWKTKNLRVNIFPKKFCTQFCLNIFQLYYTSFWTSIRQNLYTCYKVLKSLNIELLFFNLYSRESWFKKRMGVNFISYSKSKKGSDEFGFNLNTH